MSARSDVITLSAVDLQEIAREAAERAAKKVQEADVSAAANAAVIRVLQELGLADEGGRVGEAGYDMRDLRDFIQILRLVKRRITLAAIIIVMAVLTPFAIAHLKGWL